MNQQLHRKDQHVGLANQQYQTSTSSDLNQLRFVHHAFPECDVTDVNTETRLANLTFQSPFFINAMTGGSPMTTALNQRLATLAHETGLAMATGSVSIAMKEPEATASFQVVREANPDGLVFANLGAHHHLENARRAVELLAADALQIHVNVPQEMIMPEGERAFTGWLKNIEAIVAGVDVPVIVKEVGFGMSRETIATLYQLGVKIVDVSGRGGTNFARIENARRQEEDYAFLGNWGQTTLESLIEASHLPVDARPQLIASGGIQNALDIVKCLALGADLVGLSGQILQWVRQPENLDQAIMKVKNMQLQIAEIMTLLGAKTIADLRQTDMILPISTREWASARGIKVAHFACRSQRGGRDKWD